MRKSLIDTNIILRALLDDIPAQTNKAKRVLSSIEDGKREGLISILVINELVWILGRFYKRERQKFIPQILELLSLRKIKVLEIKKNQLVEILEEMEKGKLDFTDLYLAFLRKKEGFDLETFDKKLKNLAAK